MGILIVNIFRSSRPEVFCKEGILRNFTKFTGNTCARVSFLIKLGLQLYQRRDSGTGFSCEFCGISKSTFLHRTTLVAAFVYYPNLS